MHVGLIPRLGKGGMCTVRLSRAQLITGGPTLHVPPAVSLPPVRCYRSPVSASPPVGGWGGESSGIWDGDQNIKSTVVCTCMLITCTLHNYDVMLWNYYGGGGESRRYDKF